MYFTIYGVALTLFGIYIHFSNTERDTGQESIRKMFKDKDYWIKMRYLVWFSESFLALGYAVFFILALRPENYISNLMSYVAIALILYEALLVIYRYITTTKSFTIDAYVDKTMLTTKRLLWLEWIEKISIVLFVILSFN